MNEYITIIFTILLVTVLSYGIYKILLGSEKKDNLELQITTKELLSQLEILFKQKQYNILENLAINYLKKKSTNIEVRTYLAKAYYEQEKWDNAIEQAKYIINNRPEMIEIKIFLAICQKKVRNYQLAITTFNEILDSEPDNTVVMRHLAETYSIANQKISAIKTYKNLEFYIENQQELLNNKLLIAQLYTEVKDYASAILEFEEILELTPEETCIKKALIELYTTTSDYEKAIDFATQILDEATSPDEVLWALKKLMAIYNFNKNYEQALEYAMKISEQPLCDIIQAKNDIATILLKIDRTDESIVLLKSLVEENPTNDSLKKNLANAYINKNDFESAIDIYKNITEEALPNEMDMLNYELSNIYADWGVYLFNNHDNDACFKNFTTSIELCADNSETYFKLGKINMEIKSLNDAISDFKKAIEIDYTNADYYLFLSDCYDEIDSIYEQKRYLAESLKYNDKNPYTYYKLSLVYQEQNDFHNAMINMKKAVELDETYLEAKKKLALMHEHAGNIEDAEKLYLEILEVDPDNEEIKNNLEMLK